MNDESKRENNSDLVKKLKEQEQNEKRELLLLFAEKEAEGERLPRIFNMESDLTEMRFWHYKLTRDRRREAELFRLKELETKRQLLGAAFVGIGLLSKILLDGKNHKITCMQCNAENYVSLTDAPVADIEKDCLKCKKERAQVYQPQCGHVCLCKACLKNE